MNKPLIISDKNFKSLKIKKQLIKILKEETINKSNLIIVIGGDGFMLQTLKKNKHSNNLCFKYNVDIFLSNYSMKVMLKQSYF